MLKSFQALNFKINNMYNEVDDKTTKYYFLQFIASSVNLLTI